MYILKEQIESELIIKKSKFICLLFPVNDIENVNNIIKEIKSKYKDATHVCYAYIVNCNEKCFDDGEPSGTAGLPILELLKKKDLTNILAIVIRYYGGIKLGAGGLIRAYASCVKEAVNTTKLLEYKEYITIFIYGKLSDSKDLEYLTKDLNVINKNFQNDITYEISIEKDNLEKTKKTFRNYKIKIGD